MTKMSGDILRQTVFALIFLWLLLLPLSAIGQDKPSYVTAKAGLLFFTDDPKDSRNYTAFDSEIIYGYYLYPTFALEVGTGYIHDGHRGSDIRAIPLRLTAKAVYPVEDNEFYAGGGIGVYHTKYKREMLGAPFIDDDDSVLGGHVQFGANLNFSSDRFFILEGEFIVTEDLHFDGIKSDLNGFSVNIGIGFRL